MRSIIWLFVLVLIIAHQDFWFWTDETLVFGFIPIGLFYHVCLSVAAAFLWFMACQLAWPDELDRFESDKVGIGDKRREVNG